VNLSSFTLLRTSSHSEGKEEKQLILFFKFLLPITPLLHHSMWMARPPRLSESDGGQAQIGCQ